MAFFRDYRRPAAHILTDHTRMAVRNLLSLMVVKQPYYGFGLKVMPEARFDDERLHLRCIDATLLSTLWAGLSSFTIGNRCGRYLSGRQVTVHLDQASLLQIDGNLAWKADHFSFAVLPQALKIKF
jgi:diacylglycerol kinase family enzyme